MDEGAGVVPVYAFNENQVQPLSHCLSFFLSSSLPCGMNWDSTNFEEDAELVMPSLAASVLLPFVQRKM